MNKGKLKTRERNTILSKRPNRFGKETELLEIKNITETNKTTWAKD